MIYMGLDYGTKRVGVAISSEDGCLAFPYTVLPNTPELVSAVATLCTEKNIEMIVVGESKDFAGQDNPLMHDIHIFIQALKEKTTVPIVLHPEFLTSHQAVQIQGKHDMLDASAASIILQSYIDTHDRH